MTRRTRRDVINLPRRLIWPWELSVTYGPDVSHG